MRDQSEINDLLQQFIGATAGTRVEYYGYAGECLSLAKRWFDVLKNGHLNGPMTAPPSAAWGSDYWVSPPGSVSELFDKVNYDPNASYPAGSLFVNTATHHIGILVDNNPGHPTATVYQQNADPDGSAAHTAQRLKSHIDGVLQVKVAIPAPVAKYQIIETYPTGKQIQLNKDTNLWGMNYDFQTMVNNPVETGHKQGEIWTVTNKVHHIDGYDYYRRDRQVDGFNVADCNDYTPPAPAPYVPPAAPLPMNTVENYQLVTTVMYFKNQRDASDHRNAVSTVGAGNYVVLKTQDDTKLLVKKNTDTDSYWINTNDNVIAAPTPAVTALVVTTVTESPTVPVDAPVPDVTIPVDTGVLPTPTHLPKPQYLPINKDLSTVRLTSTNSVPYPIFDLECHYADTNLPAHRTEDYRMYAEVDGERYYIIERCRQKGMMYAVSTDILPKPAGIFDTNHDGRFDAGDAAETWNQFLEWGSRSYQKISDVVKPIVPKAVQARVRATKTIDGITRKAK